MTRPKNETPSDAVNFSVKLPTELHAELVKRAQNNYTNIGTIVRQAIAHYIETVQE